MLWVKIGGILLGAISLFNLARRYFDVGLSAIMSDFIDFYYALFLPIVTIINNILKYVLFFVKLPEIEHDIIVLWLVGAGLIIRFYIDFMNNPRKRGLFKIEEPFEPPSHLIAIILLLLIVPLSLFAFIVASIVAYFGRDDNNSNAEIFFAHILYLSGGAATLFALNAYSGKAVLLALRLTTKSRRDDPAGLAHHHHISRSGCGRLRQPNAATPVLTRRMWNTRKLFSSASNGFLLSVRSKKANN